MPSTWMPRPRPGHPPRSTAFTASITSIVSGGGIGMQPLLGKAMFESGEVEAAAELLERAVAGAERAGNRLTAARARLFGMELVASLGLQRQNEVVDRTRAAAAEFEELGDEAGATSAACVVG